MNQKLLEKQAIKVASMKNMDDFCTTCILHGLANHFLYLLTASILGQSEWLFGLNFA